MTRALPPHRAPWCSPVGASRGAAAQSLNAVLADVSEHWAAALLSWIPGRLLSPVLCLRITPWAVDAEHSAHAEENWQDSKRVTSGVKTWEPS